VIAPTWLLTCAHVVKKMKVSEKQDFGETKISVVRILSHSSIDVAAIEISPALRCLPGWRFAIRG